ncbi:MAG: hypothetical protein QF692_08205 [Alphaproteobacteria bacterium]|nr:hypothetical protein [Alphaproteobacteria bacterium]MDP7223227.1 hypothetical protein [Alphaproteobacteria bacterium]
MFLNAPDHLRYDGPIPKPPHQPDIAHALSTHMRILRQMRRNEQPDHWSKKFKQHEETVAQMLSIRHHKRRNSVICQTHKQTPC